MKNLLTAFAFFLTIGSSVMALADSGLNPAYEKQAQLAIKAMAEKNGLEADRWPFAEPEKWPGEKAGWSEDSPRRLISLDLEEYPVSGEVDVSGLPSLESFTLLLAVNETGSPGRIIFGDNQGLKHLTIYGEGGQIPAVIDLEALISLESLTLNNYGLDTLNLSHNRQLRALDITAGFNLAALDISANAKLESLSLFACWLTALDISRNTALKTVAIESCGLERINTGENSLPSLETFAVSSCRLPLSALAEVAAKAPGKFYAGNQRQVLFSSKVFPAVEEAVIDLSSEALINGVPTDFVVLDDKLDIADESRYSLENGVIRFKERGRYIIAMCNPVICGRNDHEIFKKVENFNRGHLPGLFTGHIDVGNVEDQKKITPSVC